MAQHEHDREDLLRDAVAMVDRIAWQSADQGEVFFGRRKNGAVSIYFDQDPVYHFTSDRQLRRAFATGRLLKAEGGRLIEMHRQRPPGEVVLASRELDDQATAAFMREMDDRLRWLLTNLGNRQLPVVGQVTTRADFETECRDWLQATVGTEVRIAESPHTK